MIRFGHDMNQRIEKSVCEAVIGIFEQKIDASIFDIAVANHDIIVALKITEFHGPLKCSIYEIGGDLFDIAQRRVFVG